MHPIEPVRPIEVGTESRGEPEEAGGDGETTGEETEEGGEREEEAKVAKVARSPGTGR